MDTKALVFGLVLGFLLARGGSRARLRMACQMEEAARDFHKAAQLYVKLAEERRRKPTDAEARAAEWQV